jgi:hypothetical protein
MPVNDVEISKARSSAGNHQAMPMMGLAFGAAQSAAVSRLTGSVVEKSMTGNSARLPEIHHGMVGGRWAKGQETHFVLLADGV